ncbi:MAG: carbon monoxide dehydrogenase [Rhizobiales bacterium]|nr:carbon monoxide dehydrogenase [Hyphomicrobiales bacterium]
MQITGETILPADPATVWRALNDAEVLRQCIPGCESLEQTGENELKATVATRIGPMQTRFTGTVTLSDLKPPVSYTISGSGSGGVAGNAKGSAHVELAPVAEGTRLTWSADAQVSGKLAQLGSRLIDSVAKSMANQFFGKFSQVVATSVGAEPAPAAARAPGALPTWAWIAIALAGAALVAYALAG